MNRVVVRYELQNYEDIPIYPIFLEKNRIDLTLFR